jgi:maltooligosyltrehalose trehalohydrolase
LIHELHTANVSILMIAMTLSLYVNNPRTIKIGESMLGARIEDDFCEFRVWAPFAKRMTLRLMRQGTTRDWEMRQEDEHFVLQVSARAGDRYFCIVDENKPVPDPVSRFLPEGVHGPTEIVDPADFAWTDRGWRGLRLEDCIIYELHVGTLTPQGTFDAAIEKLPYLKQLGVTMIELMPVAAFPGTRNWGYDGVSLYAVQASYGGPKGLRRFVNAAHAAGLGVMLDVVYNHLGNEGNYLRPFGPYFTDHHKTPWGEAINYDQECCQAVRDYVIENALYWIREYHIDGLRLDAVQTILDDSPRHILAEITENATLLGRELGRNVCMIAETDRNEEKIVRPRALGGYGFDALWSDDFQHAVHAFFTGERVGYYQDFGRPEQIVRALKEGFVFQGQPFKYWSGLPRGTPAQDLPAPAHVFCLQNHDLVGNRPEGKRMTALMPFGARLLVAAFLLLAPQTPLLFMGQEYDEQNPFLFFTDYGDPVLQKAAREGRRKELAELGFQFESLPDPQAPTTFERSKLNWRLAEGDNRMLAWYRSLLELRKMYVVTDERTGTAELTDGVICMQIPAEQPRLKVVARLQGNAPLPEPGAEWEKSLAAEADGFAVEVYKKSRIVAAGLCSSP